MTSSSLLATQFLVECAHVLIALIGVGGTADGVFFSVFAEEGFGLFFCLFFVFLLSRPGFKEGKISFFRQSPCRTSHRLCLVCTPDLPFLRKRGTRGREGSTGGEVGDRGKEQERKERDKGGGRLGGDVCFSFFIFLFGRGRKTASTAHYHFFLLISM